MSDTPTAIEAWLAVMDEVKAVGKDGTYDAGKTRYNFRGIDGVVNAVGPALRNHRVAIIPTVLDATYREVEAGANRTLMRECTVKVRYTIRGPGGDSFDGEVYGEALDSSDKGTAKATSVALRIFLLQALAIPTHEPDPDETRYERVSAPPSSEEQQRIPGLRSAVAASLAKLKSTQPETTEGLALWFKEQDLPRPERMSVEQCERVIDHLMTLPGPEGAET